MPQAHAAITMVHPRSGVTIYLPGGTHGFTKGPVPMREDHAAALAKSVMTEEEKKAADAAAKAKAEAELAAAEAAVAKADTAEH
jgi:hypothetical protein